MPIQRMNTVKLKVKWVKYAIPSCIILVLLVLSIKILHPYHGAQSDELILSHCMLEGIESLEELLKHGTRIWNNSRPECQLAENNLLNLFDMKLQSGSLVVPLSMKPLVSKWLGNDETLVNMFQNQTLIHVKNQWTLTTTIRNPLRSLKPKQQTNMDPLLQAKKTVAITQPTCDFCSQKYQEFTAEDLFGRIDSVDGIRSASNAFRFSDFHTMFFPAEHDPFTISYLRFKGLFRAAFAWFKRVHTLSPSHTHPMILWDSMPHGGASQVHPHIHAVMGQGEYLGKYLHMDSVANTYEKVNGKKYTEDYINAHVAVGLGTRMGNATIISPLDAWKDNEFVIIGPNLDEDWIGLLYDVYRLYVETLEVYCWSCGIALPTLGDTRSSLGAVARISSRGDCASPVNDVSSLDLYTFFSVNSDPYKVMKKFGLRLSKKEMIFQKLINHS